MKPVDQPPLGRQVLSNQRIVDKKAADMISRGTPAADAGGYAASAVPKQHHKFGPGHGNFTHKRGK